MGHAGGHPSDGGDFLGLDELDIGILQLLPHLQNLPHIGEDSHAADLLALDGDQGGGEGDGDFLSLLRCDGHGCGIELPRRPVLIASHLSHVFFGDVDIVKAAQVASVDDLVGGVSGPCPH